MRTNDGISGVLIVAAILFLSYNYLVFRYSDEIFQKRHKGYQSAGICVFNLFLGLMLLSNTKLGFLENSILIVGGVFAEFFFFYRRKWTRVFLIASVYATHIMSIHTISMSILAWWSYRFALSGEAVELPRLSIVLLTLSILLVLTGIAVKLMPTEKVRLVLERDEQTFFLIVWLVACLGYLLINTQVYSYIPDLPMVYQSQILFCLMLLIGVYIMIFYSFRNCSLLVIKQENQALKAEIESQEIYRGAITNHALYYYEANLSKNLMTKGLEEYSCFLVDTQQDYQKIWEDFCKRIVHPSDIETLIALASSKNLIEEFKRGKTRLEMDCRIKDQYGRYYWAEFLVSVIKDNKSKDMIAFAYFMDIDKDKQAELSLQERAERDALTGLYNKATTEMLIGERMKNGVGILFIVDVDNFKAINDYFGHVKGDEVLQVLAGELKKTFRPDDIVGRIGGDEFMVFLPIAYHESLVGRKSEDILRRFAKNYEDASGKVHQITASVGIATVNSPSMPFVSLYKQADSALYHAKNQGKNRSHIYQKSEETNFVSYISSGDNSEI